MKSLAISGSVRQNVGKRDAKELRYEGKVPCVLYGGKEQTHFAVSAADLRDLVYTPSVYYVDLSLDGNKHRAIMQDIQFHPVNDQILHIDFLELFEDKKIVLEVPVKLTGSSPGVRIGGKLNMKLRKLKVKAFPKDLTDTIEVNISKLELGKNIRVAELSIPNIEFLNSKSDTIVSVLASRVTKQAAADEAKKK